MAISDSKLRIINVLDPVMCLRCESAHIAEVLFTDGTAKKMFYCSRLDCDNWCFADEAAKEEQEGFREAA
jgi:hypothetical protein